MPLEIVPEDQGAVRVLRLKGRLDAVTSDRLQQHLSGLVRERARVVLDLGGVDYVSSAGLRVLLAAHDDLERGGGRLILAAIQDYVAEVLEVAGLDSVLPSARTVEEAVRLAV